MARASIWDVRDAAQRCPASPRKPKSGLPPPIGSPRLARPGQQGNRRLSTIGRLAIRERPPLYAHLIPPPRVGETNARLWPGRLADACNSSVADCARSAERTRTTPSPTNSARGLGRSSSVPNGRPPASVVNSRPPAMPTSLAASAAAAAAAGTAAFGYPPHLYSSGASTAIEADLGMGGQNFQSPERRAHSQMSFVDSVEDLIDGSMRSPRHREPSRGAGARADSADAAVSMQCWPERSEYLQCRPAGSTPSAPLFHRQERPTPAALGADVEGFEPDADEENAVVEELVLYTEVAPDISKAPGLGSIQPNGRAQVLQQMCNGQRRPGQEAKSTAQMQPGAPAGSRQAAARPLEALRGLLRPAPSAGTSEGPEMEWSSLSDAAKSALKQWSAGLLGGRHCMLIVMHNAGTDTSPDIDQLFSSNLRGGAALNVLSGLQAEVELITQQEESWLFTEIFLKPPAKVLEDGIAAALEEMEQPQIQGPSDLSVEQANLALRRRAMKVQCTSPVAKSSTECGPKSSDEYIRTQIWLELLRQCIEGPKGGAQASKDKPQKGERPPPPWNDCGVLRDLGKSELDLEVESEKMSLDAIRSQNRHIEEYVMRLVRQRDELRSMMKMTEERDSYFILGLEGPESTEEEVKKAYRNLARKEHPDKAGIGNKRRFQAIQQAYDSIVRQKNEGSSFDAADKPGCEHSAGSQFGVPGAAVREALSHARRAKERADGIAICAHHAMKYSEDCAELQNVPKRRAFRAMMDLTKRSIAELRGAAEHLRGLGESVCSIAACADTVMNEQKDAADKTVAGVGMRDRAVIVEDQGRNALTSGELLEKISEATEATLRKVEKADAPGSQGAGRDESANLLRLGVRLLSESLTRTAAVARRSADEAIGAAVKAHELTRGLAAADLEARKEREKTAAKKSSFDDEGDIIVAEDCTKAEGTSENAAPQHRDQAAAGPNPPAGGLDATGGQTTPQDQLKSAARRVKERHVSLRVKNLSFLATLNEESLKLQRRLRSLLERGEGALLPAVSILQKKQVFDLVSQLLDFSVAEVGRLSASTDVASSTPSKVFERALSFALTLEHAKEVAMPTESRTQALKLAALIDSDLLCQVIGGPFRDRLAAAVARKGAGNQPAVAQHGRLKVRGTSSEINSRAWSEAANAYCTRIISSIQALTSADAGDAPLA